MVKAEQELSAAAARQLALKAQLLWKTPTKGDSAAVTRLVEQLGAVQLDTISVLARSHELVPRSRLAGLDRSGIEAAYWAAEATHFEYWSHAACLLPIADWPLYEFRRAAYRARGQRWHAVSKRHLQEVKARLSAEGPGTAQDFGGSRKTAAWWNWSEVKIALEWLLDIGEVTCTRRVGWRRVYDLTERAITNPPASPLPAAVAIERLLVKGLSALGVATKADLLDYQRLVSNRPDVQQAWAEFSRRPEVVPVRVAGWRQPAFAAADALATLDRSRPNAAVMLSPFDSLIWYRDRMERLFDMHHRIEAYTKAADRVYGYFAMPVLAGDRLVARVDPGKKPGTLVAKQVVFEAAKPTSLEVAAVARALQQAAGWIGAAQVELQTVLPAAARRPLAQLV